MKKKILCFVLAASMVLGNAGMAFAADGNGQASIEATKEAGTPYTGEERTLSYDKPKVGDDTSLPAGWSWKTPDQVLTGTFADTVAVYSATGKNANEVTVKMRKVMDTAAPAGEISIGTDKWASFLNTITFGFFFKETKEVKITADDDLSGVGKIEYYIANAALSQAQAEAVTDWKTYDSAFNLNPENKYVVYARITDKAGNTTYLSSDGLVFVNLPVGYVTDIGVDGAKLNMKLSDSVRTEIKAAGFEYKKKADADTAWTKVAADSVTETVTKEITSLTAGTDYVFRPYVTYTNDSTDTGAEQNFTTDTKPTETPGSTTKPTETPTTPTETPATPTETPASQKDKVTKTEKAAAKISINAGLKVSQSGKKVTVKWGKVSKADRYVVCAAYCGPDKCTKIKTLSGSKTSMTFTKLNGSKLNLKKNIKVYVVAYRKVNGKETKLARSITAHIVGTKNTKYTNVKKIKLSKSKYTLKVNKTATIKAKIVLVDKKKKQLSDSHAPEFRYASSNTKVATVDKNGKITAVKKGTCYIYVYAKNGYAKKVKVTVK